MLRTRMQAVRVILPLLLEGLCFGCAHQALDAATGPANGATLARPVDVVWERTMRILAKQRPVVTRAGQGHFVITTDAVAVRLNETHADCGKYAGTPYVNDGRTVTMVAYSVELHGGERSTTIAVHAAIEGHFQGTATHDATVALSCVSRGALERDLIRKIQEEPGTRVRAKARG